MLVLALDTALSATTVALARDGRLIGSRCDPMERGHQERLAVLVGETMEGADVRFEALNRIGVTVGPGSFTGVRVGLAFAKGLALAWATLLTGVGSLEALAESVEADGVKAAVIDARRGRVYLQLFRNGAPLCEPDVVDIDAAVEIIERLGVGPHFAPPLTLIGSGAALLAERVPGAAVAPLAYPTPEALVRLAAEPALPARTRRQDTCGTGQMRRAVLGDAPALAAIHASAFEVPWTAKALTGFMGDAGAITFVAGDPEAGFILIRALAGEAEVLTLAVDPSARRAGLGRALVEAAARAASGAGATFLFLEVAEDNLAAVELYRAVGFETAGRRAGYYRRVDGPAMDALVLRRDLGPAGA